MKFINLLIAIIVMASCTQAPEETVEPISTARFAQMTVTPDTISAGQSILVEWCCYQMEHRMGRVGITNGSKECGEVEEVMISAHEHLMTTSSACDPGGYTIYLTELPVNGGDTLGVGEVFIN